MDGEITRCTEITLRRVKSFPRLAPAFFVFLWSTGFIGVKYGIPYAPPFTFVALRMAIASVLLALITFAITKGFRLSKDGFWKSCLIGLALHGAYLAGCFYAVSQGMTAGIVALIVCLQPVIVSVLAIAFLGESLEGRTVIGLLLGLSGVSLVIVPKIVGQGDAHISGLSLLACIIALFGGSLGTLAQKKFGSHIEALPGVTVQYGATAIVIGVLALLSENPSIEWTGKFIFSMIWLIVALSLGAILLLFFLLQRGSAASVSSLYYLVPPVTALMAYLLFDEEISYLTGVGTIIAVSGVWLVTKKHPQQNR